ncbi:hypothetical protein Q3H53_000871 [Microcystis aeruginosa PCC 7806]|nr:hypothetical protein [Microcystis aeruginosa]UGS11327.1 hypothetical protein LRR78_04340 [Microcystis aeruginosa FACHB-905 = DIANCHI905]WKX60991.1 hypothetical protein Q3H53_000871 [Microcystis aeruginosa PCC 7806]
MWRFLSIVFHLKRTHQLSLLPGKDLVNLCPPIEPYQVTKSHIFFLFLIIAATIKSNRHRERRITSKFS